MITLSIDGKETTVAEGTTVLEAALAAGVEIPTLCYHTDLDPNAACRLCTVEVTQNGRSRMTAACALPAEDGMEIATASERVLTGRRVLMELLVARCSEIPQIKELAEQIGAKTGRLAAKNDECILCGLCVGVCSQVMGARVIGFSNRGVEREVVTKFGGVEAQCLACGACAYLCPTGYMKKEHEKLSKDKDAGTPRECRYMRMGVVPYAICPSAYQCYQCEVDQQVEDTTGTHGSFMAHPGPFHDPVDVGGYAVMPNRYYHAGHTWAEPVGGHLRLGVDDFAASLIGKADEVVLLKEKGADVAAGEGLWRLVLGDGKSVTVRSPVSGTVVVINEDVLLDPTLVSKSPYARGWVCLVRPSAADEELAKLRFKRAAVPAYLRTDADAVSQWMSADAEKLSRMQDEEAEWQALSEAFLGAQQ